LTVLPRLASALGRRNQAPNLKLALEIVTTNDAKAVKELIENLSNKDRAIRNDCLKVLYEIGYRGPGLIAAYTAEFAKLLLSKDNRLVWGGMTALDSIASVDQKGVYGLLEQIVQSANGGSVITRDHAVGILAKLAAIEDYRETCLPILLQQLEGSPDNQFPSYVEISIPVVGRADRGAFTKLVEKRLASLEKESQRRRVEKALRALSGADS